jgi:hypothetical protein
LRHSAVPPAGGTNTRRERRALAALFAVGGVGKDVVSRVWRQVKSDWDAWQGIGGDHAAADGVPPEGRGEDAMASTAKPLGNQSPAT